MGRYSLTSAWLRRKRLERGIPSAVALARAAGLTVSHVATLERGEVQPRPATFRRMAAALKLSHQERHEFQQLAAADRLPDEPADLQRWVYLPAWLLALEHDDGAAPRELIVDDWLADSVRCAGSLLGWLGLRATAPLASQLLRLRAAAQHVFDESLRLGEEYRGWGRSGPQSAAADAASALPRAWRNEVFANRRKTARMAGLLRRWAYFPRRSGAPAHLGAALKDEQLQMTYCFGYAPVEMIINVHDALIAHRLWSVLDLTHALGTTAASAQEQELETQLGTEHGDLYTLRTTKPEQIALWSVDQGDQDAREGAGPRREAFIAAAQRVDLAYRLFELPDLANQVFHSSRAEVEATLRHAVELVGTISPRFCAASPPSGTT